MLNDRTMDRYLHAILLLGTRFLIVRAVDVAAWLEYSKASVSVAVKQMLDEKLISVGSHGALLLTADGQRRASAFHERYDFFYRLLTEAGIDEAVARKEA
ncbi:MAG: metal-dependent transcriptional regulator, partial [Clostridia bacterium]|nr:metal-dependent transcriptional regulator [Clostridia bacterium]